MAGEAHANSRRETNSLLLALAGSLGFAPAARAADPITADMFEVRFAIPGQDGATLREMSALDRDHFVNQARCECGQPLRATVRLREQAADVDETTLIQSMIGPYCPYGDAVPDGPFRPCGIMASATAPSYFVGQSVDFHPIFLSSDIDASSGGVRDVQQPTTVLARRCDNEALGWGGVWVCVESNATPGCQPDEVILQLDDSEEPGTTPRLIFDYMPPVVRPEEVAAVSADSGVQLRWVVGQPGDIHGFRVLCERSDDGQPAASQRFDPPDPFAEPDGTHYFNAHNLCDDQPILSYKSAIEPAGDGSCGDGVRDPGEACDDGEANDIDGLCRSDCSLGVSAELHALDWAYLCSDHLDLNTRSINIYGLENGVDYNFVLVTYDAAGNPRAHPVVAQATPDRVFERLPGDPHTGCGCRGADVSPWSALVLLLGLGRRRRVVRR